VRRIGIMLAEARELAQALLGRLALPLEVGGAPLMPT
jgi:hypothetical protein